MNYRFRIHIILFLLLSLFIIKPAASQDNTMYFMYGIPQAIHTNPALFYKCRTYVELPVISSIRYAFANTGFGYHDALHYGTGVQSDSILIDIGNLDKKLKKRNWIRNDVSVNLLGAGFRIKEFYFHFNISNHLRTYVGYPGGLISLTDGNWNPNSEIPMNINLSGLGITAYDYTQIAVGASRRIYEGFYIGGTLKYLMGSTSLITRRSNLEINTTADPIVLDVSSRYRINASFPAEITYDSLGIVQSIDFTNSSSDIISDFIFNKNRGASIDAGVIYEYTENLTFAASIVDLGFIRWKSNVNRFESEGSFTFRGFDLKEYTTNTNQTDLLQSLVDSIVDSWEFTNSNDPYWNMLPVKIYAGGMYRLNPKIAFGALGATEIFDHRPHFSLTLSANFNPVKWFNGTVSYSMMNSKLYQLGLGFGLGGPGAQFYFIADHIPIRFVRDTYTGAIYPYNARTVNFRLGINLIFGCKKTEGEGRPPAFHGHRPRKLCPAYD